MKRTLEQFRARWLRSTILPEARGPWGRFIKVCIGTRTLTEISAETNIPPRRFINWVNGENPDITPKEVAILAKAFHCNEELIRTANRLEHRRHFVSSK